MSLTKLLLNYLLTAVVFFAIDLLWLGVVAKNLYNKYLGDFLADKVNWTAAMIFYLLNIVGISIFAIYPAVNKDSPAHALIMGGLFGLFTYATYDLTNLATLKNWPIEIVFIDIAWGIILTAAVAVSGFYIVKMVG